jgi:uncharacterized protein (TIGR03435 family)
MTRKTRIFLVPVIASIALGQPRLGPRFEVASIRIYPAGSVVPPETQGLVVSPDGIRATHVVLRGCLQGAYGILDVSGPAWITEESYDIVAKTAAPVARDQLMLMFQALLEERFQLKLRRETVNSSVGVLTVAKTGTKNLRRVEDDGGFEIKRAGGRVEMKNATIPNLVNVLRSPFGNMPMEPVVDQTGLSGRYDLVLDLSGFDLRGFDGYQEMRAALFAYVAEAVERSYGLKLDRRTLPQERLIVEAGNRVPTEN